MVSSHTVNPSTTTSSRREKNQFSPLQRFQQLLFVFSPPRPSPFLPLLRLQHREEMSE